MTTNGYDAIVIGSGLGGLTAGALAARSGARVLVLERNDTFGGAASTYRHGALTVEASLHDTADPRAPGDPKHAVFAALDLADDVELIPIDDFYEVRCPLIGEPFVLPHGYEAVRARLIERFPNQRKSITGFLRHMRRAQDAIEYMGGGHDAAWALAHAPELPLDLWAAMRDIRASLSDVLSRFFGDDEAIKFALAANLPYYADDPDTLWWLGFAIPQGGYLRHGGCYIKGGSQTLSDRLAEIIREDGGETLSGREAVGIDLDGQGAAAAVRHRPRGGGPETRSPAPLIFANAAPHVIEGMLPANRREAFMAPFRDRPLSISLFSATIGLNRPAAAFGVSSYSTQLIPAWMQRLSDYRDSAALLGEAPQGRMPALGIVDYSRIDSGLVGDGVHPMNVVCTDRTANWEGLDQAAYEARRQAWLDAIVARLDEEWPGLAGAVVDTAVATARSMQSHLNTPGGALYGFALTPPAAFPKGPPISTQTAVPGVLLASSFAGFGGFSGAMGCGANAARAARHVGSLRETFENIV